MRQWRVGSFSMALVLILLGIALLISQLNDVPAWKLVANWWPAAMILLGVEILLAGFFSKVESPRLKYDFFAVIMVILVGAASLGFYALASSGLLKEVEKAVTAAKFETVIPESRITVPGEIKKVVFRSGNQDLQVRSSKQSGSIMIFGRAEIYASSKGEADQIASSKILSSHMVGDTLFVDLTSLPSFRDRIVSIPMVGQSSYTLFVPENIQLGIDRAESYAKLDVIIDSLRNSWSVSNAAPVQISVGKTANVEIQAVTNGELGGNAAWLQKKVDGQQVAGEEAFFEGDGRQRGEVSGSVKIGQGRYILKVDSRSGVRVNVD